LLLCGLVISALADSDMRGVWFWQSGGLYGSTYVIADPTLRTQNINWMQYHGIDRVYGSYGSFVGTSNEANVVAWNAELDAAGIESHLLLGGAAPILDDPVTPVGALSNLLDKITSRFVDFNAGLTDAAERFDAIHLDIEPQQLPEWDLYPDAGDLPLRLENRRQLYLKLRDTFQAIRNHLVAEGVGTTLLFADLNDWVDKITPSIRFKWETAAERAQYYADLAQELDGITLMSYELPTFPEISSRVSWETSSVSGMAVRIGLDVDVGVSNTWPTVAAFWDMADQVETAFGEERGIDIHSYADIRSQYTLATVDGVTVATGIGVGVGITPGVAVFVGEKSVDLETWEPAGMVHVGRGGFEFLFPIDADHGYFRIGLYGEDAPYKDRPGPYAVSPAETGMIHTARTLHYTVTSPVKTANEPSHPLIVFSPDENQPADVFNTLAHRLASWGGVCIAVGHPAGPETNRSARAGDLREIIDRALAGTIAPRQTAGRIDSRRVAAIGQGVGSTTVLKLCGLQFSPSGQGSPPVHLTDSRVRAAVAFSPRVAGADGITSNSWQTLSAPAMFISGSSDVTPAVQVPSARKQGFRNMPSGGGYQLWLDGAEHTDFTDVGILRRGDAILQWYTQAILAFLDAELNSDGAAALWLRAQTANRLSRGAHRLDWK